MPRLRTTCIWALAGCLLLAAGALYPLTVPHAAHHGHHSASTHASALCAWLCAAGQAVEAQAASLDAAVLLIAASWQSPIDLTPASSPETAPARGPPDTLLSLL